ncbi:helix-turn-helix domain-containing protein [Spirillospora sp. NPDC047279]|uniref:ArsR/SmtB family transcription factor n=1 Tax=Spirillospora sp. NPDC047279 TaxID=3155478 RepID=UPI0033D79382
MASTDDRSADDRLSSLEARMADLEARLAAATAAGAEPQAPGAPPAPAEATRDETGYVRYGGEARLGGYEWGWDVARSPGELVRLPAAPLAAVLQAAGHPARLEVLKLLLTGPRTVTELQSELGLNSTGQLYHHLKALTGAGLVEQTERAVYRLPPPVIFPVLAMTAAAFDVTQARNR